MKSLTLKEIARYDLIMGVISLITAFSAVIIPIYKHHSELHSLSDFLNLFLIIVIYEIVAFSALLIILLVLKSVLKLIYFYKDRLEILKKR